MVEIRKAQGLEMVGGTAVPPTTQCTRAGESGPLKFPTNMSKSIPQTLDAPPFPPLTWDQFFYKCTITLEAWRGFQSRSGPYGSQDSTSPSNGQVCVYLKLPEGAEAPSGAQVAAYRFLTEHTEYQRQLRDAILEAVFKQYSSWQKVYNFGDDADEFMPPIERPADLRRLIGLSNVHFLPNERDGCAYVGFEFGCTWDDEHGLGVMTHKARIVEIGGADSSFTEWVADLDARRDQSTTSDVFGAIVVQSDSTDVSE